MCGVSKSQSSVDYAMLEYCIREDLKMKKPRMMAVLDPIKTGDRQLSGRRSGISGCREQSGESGTWCEKSAVWT